MYRRAMMSDVSKHSWRALHFISHFRCVLSIACLIKKFFCCSFCFNSYPEIFSASEYCTYVSPPTDAVLLQILFFVYGMGWAMINPDIHYCFFCLIVAAKGISQEYKQPRAHCPAGHLERIACHHDCTVSLVHKH